MTFLYFLRSNAPWLSAGGLMTLGSSFGQTYFISIFAGEIRGEFGLSHEEWGRYYLIGTTASAALMMAIGGVADLVAPRRLAVITLVVFSAVCLAMAAVPVAWMIPVVIFGLRFCGQGMMTHIAMVAVGRWFAAVRGRAVSVVALGFSAGEALMPVIFVMVMAAVGWRGSWVVTSCLVLLFIPPLMVLLRQNRIPQGEAQTIAGTGMHGRHWTRRDALTHWLFWLCIPNVLAQPIFGTAFFFQQVHLTEIKGWELAEFVRLIPLYTGTTVTMLFVGGALVDRFGCARVMPFFLLPMTAGFTVIALGTTLGSAALGMMFLGAMHGIGVSVMTVFWPEFYGTRHLGSIRATATSFMVFSTGLGPWATGYLIDRGVGYETQLLFMAGYGLVASVFLFVLMFKSARLFPTEAPDQSCPS